MIVKGAQDVSDYGSVIYTVALPDGTTMTRSADFSKHTGNAVHYVDRFSGTNGTYTLVSASATVDGVNYDLANPESSYVVGCRRCNLRSR